MGCTPTRLEVGMEVRTRTRPSILYPGMLCIITRIEDSWFLIADASGREYRAHAADLSLVTDADRAAQRYPADEPTETTATGTN